MKKIKVKCRACDHIIDVKNNIDIFTCNCGEVSIDSIHGQIHANVKSDMTNLTVVDEEGKEIIPKLKESQVEHYEEIVYKDENDEELVTRRELLSTLDAMIHNIRSLPPQARTASITHSDFEALLSLLSVLFRAS